MKPSLFTSEIIEKYAKDEELARLLVLHSRCVAEKAVKTAREAGLEGRVDLQFVYDAAMLHDIGVVECDAPSIHCHGKLPYICHGIAGGKILRAEGLGEKYARVCERHTGAGITREDIENRGLPLSPGDYMPETMEEKLICYADKFYSKSGDPTAEKPLEKVRGSMARHGEESLRRFEELHRLFAPAIKPIEE